MLHNTKTKLSSSHMGLMARVPGGGGGGGVLWISSDRDGGKVFFRFEIFNFGIFLGGKIFWGGLI